MGVDSADDTQENFTTQELQLFMDMGVDELAQAALWLMLKSSNSERQEQVRDPVRAESEQRSNE